MPLPAPAPVPLPSDLDTLAKRDLVALCEERSVSVPNRATADDIRETLRSHHRIAVECFRMEQIAEVRAEWAAKPAHAPLPENDAAQVVRDSLWGLANLFGRDQHESDSLVHAIEQSLPVLNAFLKGDERVTQQDARNAVYDLTHTLASLRRSREDAADYAAFSMGDATRRVNTLRDRAEARRANRK